MIDKKDYDYIKERFDGDGLKAPDRLSADNIMKQLDGPAGSSGPAPKPAPLYKRRWFRPVIAAAACLALVLGTVPFMNLHKTTKEGDLELFSSYSERNHRVKEMSEHSMYLTYGGYEGNVMMEDADQAPEDFEAIPEDQLAAAPQEDLAAEPTPNSDAPSMGEQSAKSSDHSETYSQVEGVDEADIVKTDGRYIYFTSYVENQVVIAKADKGKTERVGAINAGQIGSTIEDLYVKDGKLTVIGTDADPMDLWSSIQRYGRTLTTVTIFDVSDPSKPKQLSQYTQTGSLLSSRMTDGKIILVTNDFLHSYKKNQCIPYVSFDEEGPDRLEIGDICGIPKASDPAYTVIGCVDTATGKFNKDTVKTKAVLGGSSEIYCNKNNLFITADVTEPDDYIDDKTCILKVSIQNGTVQYKKTATIPGNVNDQFSMDEAGGYFKIAVTDFEAGHDINSLYILDENMKQVGSVKNFAPDEHIEAVRYIKDKAYVITYEQTDPLFIIDLKDPANPVIEGHVKITGFSTLLVPSGKDYLLGLGFSTTSTEMGEATDGVKLSLFDIRNPSAPKVADAKEFTGMDSEVQYNHKALLVGPDASYYAIPYSQYVDSTDSTDSSDSTGIVDYDEYPIPDLETGVLVFSVKSGKLTDVNKHPSKEAVKRCLYIGDYIYNICEDDSIESFTVK